MGDDDCPAEDWGPDDDRRAEDRAANHPCTPQPVHVSSHKCAHDFSNLDTRPGVLAGTPFDPALGDKAEPLPEALRPKGGGAVAGRMPTIMTDESAGHWLNRAGNYTLWLVTQPTHVQEAILGIDRAANLRSAYAALQNIANGTAPTEEVIRCHECKRPWDDHAADCSRPVPF